MKRLHGVTTAMITPFDQGGEVHVEAMEQLTEFLIRRGVDCLYPCGTTGEMFLMTEQQRKTAAEAVVRQNAGRKTVYIHVGAMHTEETIRLARHACDIGADGVGIVTPAFFGTNPEAMTQYYLRVLHAIPQDFPAYLYNIPQCAANDLTCDVIRRILDACPNAVGIKYSLADLVRTDEYLNLREGFDVLQGADRLFLPVLAMGCSGTVSGVSCVYPEPFVQVYAAYRAGDLEAARRWQRLANRFVTALGAGVNMALFKSGLRFRGLNGGHMHSPQIDYTPQQEAELWATLEALEAECPDSLLTREEKQGMPL